MTKQIIFAVILMLVAGGIYAVFRNTPDIAGIANPASEYCVKQGGEVEIREGEGGQVGYCHTSDGRVCEEWAFFRDSVCVPPLSEGDLVKSAPTNFVHAGTVTFNNPGQKEGVPYLIYEEPGAPALSVELIFDALSACAAPNGSTACMAMSVTLDIPFNGKRVIVEGEKTDEQVLVRKLRVLEEGEDARVGDGGDVFISWPQAMMLIRSCQVTMAMQTHALDVYLTLKDGERVRAIEPMIDEMFQVVQEANASCGTIPLATE